MKMLTKQRKTIILAIFELNTIAVLL